MHVCAHNLCIIQASNSSNILLPKVQRQIPIPNQTSPTAFQFVYMTLAINITNGRGFSNEARL